MLVAEQWILHTKHYLVLGHNQIVTISHSMPSLQVKIWDTAGSEKYMSISTVYYRKADGVIFIFDVTKPRTFTNIETVWMNAVEAPER